jgi:integrase
VTTVKLRGIKKVTRRLATGRIETYCYAWKGGPRLHGRPGSPEFIANYNKALADRKQPSRGELRFVVTKFRESSAYMGLSAATKRAYSSYLDAIGSEFGDMPLAALADPRVRGVFFEWRDSMSATPRNADYAWSVLARVLSFAKDRGLITSNPCERGGRLYRADRADRIWTDADLNRLFAVASPEVAAVVRCALWTGQRQGDILAMPWSGWDGQRLAVRQSKTGRRVTIPAPKALAETIAALPRVSPTMFVSSEQRPWTGDGFRSSFAKACERAKIDGLTFHDLRGTAVTRLALAGCTTAEIAAITGHSLKDLGAIIDRHYLSRTDEMSENAIRKLEKRTETGKRLENGETTELPAERTARLTR